MTISDDRWDIGYIQTLGTHTYLVDADAASGRALYGFELTASMKGVGVRVRSVWESDRLMAHHRHDALYSHVE